MNVVVLVVLAVVVLAAVGYFVWRSTRDDGEVVSSDSTSDVVSADSVVVSDTPVDTVAQPTAPADQPVKQA